MCDVEADDIGACALPTERKESGLTMTARLNGKLTELTEKDLWPGARVRGDQIGIRCIFMRGGTSRGAYLNEKDLPSDPKLRERLILAIYGSPDVRQIDGLGGADPLTSKVAIVGPSTHPNADVNYTFGQVRINETTVDFAGNCGNISSGVPAFAIDEGLVATLEPVTTVRIHNTNTDAIISADVMVQNGIALVEGDAAIDGVPGTGAPVLLDFREKASTLGMGILPTGSPIDILDTDIGKVEVSLIDAGNPAVFVQPSAFGITGTELPAELTDETLSKMELVRSAAAVHLGLVDTPKRAAEVTPAVPKLYVMSPPTDYIDLAGRAVRADQINVVGRGLIMRVPHQAYAATMVICTATAAQITGTIVERATKPDLEHPGRIRIGHPSGVVVGDAVVEWENRMPVLRRAAIERTARRIMEGMVYVPIRRVFF
jgi:2-methylaconitate cis-trans-isomerase PrpF